MSNYLDFEELVTKAVQGGNLSTEDLIFNKNHYETLNQSQNNGESSLSLAAIHYFLSDTIKSQIYLDSLSGMKERKFICFELMMKGVLMLKLENIEKSLQYFLEAETTSQGKIINLVQEKIIDLCLSQKKWEDAVEFFGSFRQIADSCMVYCKIAFCYERMGNLGQAAKMYVAASNFESQFSVLCEVWADMLRNDFNLEKFQVHLNSQSSHPHLITNIKYLQAYNLIKKDSFTEGQKLLKEICEGSNNELYWLALGYIHIKQSNIAHSFASTLKSIKLNQNIGESWFNLAVIYSTVQQGESHEALIRAHKLGISNEDLSSPILPNVEIWNLNAEKVKKLPKKLKKEEKKEKFEIIIPTAVKVNQSTSYVPYSQEMMMMMFHKMLNDMKKNNEDESRATKANEEQDKEIAEILTHLNLPSKRHRATKRE